MKLAMKDNNIIDQRSVIKKELHLDEENMCDEKNMLKKMIDDMPENVTKEEVINEISIGIKVLEVLKQVESGTATFLSSEEFRKIALE